MAVTGSSSISRVLVVAIEMLLVHVVLPKLAVMEFQ